jgi:hypothetical protein
VTRAPTRAAVLALALLLAPPLWANGGIVRISSQPLGPWFVTVYSSPTPLRTGELDISVLVQDSTDALVDVPIAVNAVPVAPDPEAVEGAPPGPVRKAATRAQATNKLFKAAKFDVDVPGEWEFVVEVEGAGSVSFRSVVARTTLLDRPYLLAVLVLLPVGVVGWLLLGRGDD